jgi:hypothetical protein
LWSDTNSFPEKGTSFSFFGLLFLVNQHPCKNILF